MKNNNNKISLIQILSLVKARRVFEKPSRVYKRRYGITRGKQSLGIHFGLKSKYYFLGDAGNKTFIPSMPTMYRNNHLKIDVLTFKKRHNGYENSKYIYNFIYTDTG